ncbi:MAG: hypothetical protein QG579_68 [Patescibacteria group bacterium]|jgi:hypothetical protein|nr:hypothetical protein [Patescibacteria group bacterium]
MKKHTIIKILLVQIYLIPVITLAAADGIKGLISDIGNVMGIMQPILLGLSVVYFFWGIGQFILHDAGSEKTREDGKRKMMWGVIAIFVFISINGILGWFGDLIGISVSPSTPSVTTSEEYNLDQLNP